MTFHYVPSRDRGDDTDGRQEQAHQRARRRRCPECSGLAGRHSLNCPGSLGEPEEAEAGEVAHG